MLSTYSIFEFEGTGSEQLLPVPEYLDRSHIQVFVGGQRFLSFGWVNAATISLTAPAGEQVLIRRATSPEARLVSFREGVPLTQADMEVDSKQAFFMGQEAIDSYARILDLAAAPTADPQAAVLQASLARDQALAAAAALTGVAGLRKAIIGTGVAATDSAALREAIRTAAARTRIEFFGHVVLEGTFILKPLLTFANGSASRITHTTPDVNLFELRDDGYYAGWTGSIQPPGTVWTGAVPLDPATNRTVDAFPVEISFEGLRITGAGIGTLLPLGTIGAVPTDVEDVPAAIHIGANGSLVSITKTYITQFKCGVLIRDVYLSSIADTQTLNCGYGILLYRDCHVTTLQNVFTNYCTRVGLGINYGFGTSIGSPTQTPQIIGGAYQWSQVGIWLEGVYNTRGEGVYFEGNSFRDIQNGVGDAGVYSRFAYATNWDGGYFASPVGDPGGRNVQIEHSIECKFNHLYFNANTPTNRSHVDIDGFCDKTEVDIARYNVTGTTPPMTAVFANRQVLKYAGIEWRWEGDALRWANGANPNDPAALTGTIGGNFDGTTTGPQMHGTQVARVTAPVVLFGPSKWAGGPSPVYRSWMEFAANSHFYKDMQLRIGKTSSSGTAAIGLGEWLTGGAFRDEFAIFRQEAGDPSYPAGTYRIVTLGGRGLYLTASEGAPIRIETGGRAVGMDDLNGVTLESPSGALVSVQDSGQIDIQTPGALVSLSSLGVMVSSGPVTFNITSTGAVTLSGLPTSNPGGSNRLWRDAGTLKIT